MNYNQGEINIAVFKYFQREWILIYKPTKTSGFIVDIDRLNLKVIQKYKRHRIIKQP